MSAKRITGTEAARKFSDLLNRVRYGREAFDVVRRGVVIARLVPAAHSEGRTLRALMASLETAGPPIPGLRTISKPSNPVSARPRIRERW